MTLINSHCTLKFTGKTVERNGKVYMQTDDLRFSLEPKLLVMNFENLFNGDKTLGPTTNLFLNENWSDIYKELQVSIERAFGQVIETIINNVFAGTSYKNAFLN